MIDRTHPLPVVRQCQLLRLARSTAYYQPTPVSEPTLALMRRIDELHLQYPFAGSPNAARSLTARGRAIGRRQVATLMRRMGIAALYRKPCTSSAASCPPDLSLSPARSDDHSPESRLGGGYHLHSDATRLRVSVRHPGLGESPGAGLAALQYADHGLLPRRRAGGDHAAMAARRSSTPIKGVSSPARSSRGY